MKQNRACSHQKAATQTARYWSERLNRVDPLAAVLTYNAPPVINRAYDTWERGSLERNLPESLKGQRALDLGCGTGRITVLLARAGARVTGVDISTSMLDTCCRRARRVGLGDRVELLESPADRFDLGGIKFDLVTCFGLLEHLRPRERQRCLEIALERLKKRGRMLVVINNAECVYFKTRTDQPTNKAPVIPGHYVVRVGLKWLEQFCRKHRVKIKLLAANPFYSWLHYGLWANAGENLYKDELKKLARRATRLDLTYPLAGPAPKQLASHFLVELRR